ncbi:polysaccharide biosynthesis protein [Pedobacter changchengzhani]|uniref:Polysaccharide biosynthesis protein n=1 Tax=Pedobacter changchengzhani TaxID=2529274 RepID=A0A4R5MPJ8_9SPHI|nr:polysaccharide biosynthesis C-terminal domain-containing protein [Pedobacter changchengzhani]TDG37742.1 polysaccharide biosynthesis protein [Pedobacter changchengzhani]
MSVYKKFLGQTMVYGISTIFSRLFNFILTPIYTSVFPTNIYGIFTKMFSYVSIINPILAFGMETTYFRYLNKHSDRKEEVYNNSFLVIGFIATLFLITGLIFSDFLARYTLTESISQLPNQILYVKYFVWILFFDAISVIPFAKLRADGKPLRYSVIKFLNIGVFVSLNLIFIYAIPFLIAHGGSVGTWFSSWYKGIWVGYVFIANLIASISTFIFLLPQFLEIRFRFNKSLFYDMFGYSWPVLIANLSFIINENLDKILLGKYLPSAIADHETGIYGAVCKLAIFISIFNTAFRLGAEPFFFSHAKNANAKNTYASILYYFVLALALLFVGLTANIEILKHFINHKYWVGLPAVPYLLFGYVCLGIYMNLSIWYRLSDQTRFGLYISLVGAVFTIVMNIILIPIYSYMGSAVVSMMAYFIIMVISYVLGQKYYPIPYKIKRMSAYLLTSILIVYLSFWVFNRNIYIGNGLLVLFLAIIAYFEKTEIKKMIKSAE